MTLVKFYLINRSHSKSGLSQAGQSLPKSNSLNSIDIQMRIQKVKNRGLNSALNGRNFTLETETSSEEL